MVFSSSSQGFPDYYWKDAEESVSDKSKKIIALLSMTFNINWEHSQEQYKTDNARNNQEGMEIHGFLYILQNPRYLFT